jgi:hypothetical protein
LKKAITILLLSIFLFSICGYRLVFLLAGNYANQSMITSIDKNNYNEQDLVLIKFALHIPYLQNNSSYERCDGEVEFNGVQYNYVKRMVANDTVYLYCLPNIEKTNIANIQNIYASQTADNATGKKAVIPIPNVFSFAFEFNLPDTEFNFSLSGIGSAQESIFIHSPIQKGFTWQPSQPPNLFI